MDPLFRLIEESGLSTWLRESESIFAFPATFTLHVVSVGLVVGISVAINLRLLGFLPKVSLAATERYLPIFWFALLLNVSSGVLLMIGYPTKTLTNPLFYVKIGAIVLALATLFAVRRSIAAAPDPEHPSARMKGLAVASLGLWAVAVAGGRLLAYTYTRLLVDF